MVDRFESRVLYDYNCILRSKGCHNATLKTDRERLKILNLLNWAIITQFRSYKETIQFSSIVLKI